jgi:hypothetical protein
MLKSRHILKDYENLRIQGELLRSVPCIGVMTTATFLADLPEFGKLERKKTPLW